MHRPQWDSPKIAQGSLSVLDCRSLTATERTFKSSFVLKRAIYGRVCHGTAKCHRFALSMVLLRPNCLNQKKHKIGYISSLQEGHVDSAILVFMGAGE